ncbi:MAG TPA: serine/threonine-protein kinase [Polyangia bacterium]
MIGERINNYEVRSILGEGGMGAVYLAEHPFMGRKAAIKVLRRELAEDQGLVERFMNEARAANAIHHPNIIDIIDVGVLPSGIPYLMMEFLDGESLAKRIERQVRMPVAEAVDAATQTAAALHAAHGKGIVHRDLKPDNLFLVPDDGKPFGTRVKVLDFGIAKLRGELSGSGAKTQSGSVMGTPPYMSPEQCRGITEEIDHRTDVYALGIIVYEMLTGAPPFMSAGWGDVVLMHVTKPVPPPRSKNPDIPAALEAVILKALAKLADDRWPSMAEMDAALRKSIGAPPKGFVSGFDTPGGPAAAVTSGSGRVTTLGASSGEVTPGHNDGDADEIVQGPARLWRRPPVLVGGGVALAAAIAVIAWGGRRTPAVSTAPSGAAASASPAPAAAVVQAPASPPVVAPAPAPVTPPPAVAPAKPVTPEAPAVRFATDESSEHLKTHAHKHEPHATKKTASAAPAPASAPAPPGTTPAPARPKAVEKW